MPTGAGAGAAVVVLALMALFGGKKKKKDPVIEGDCGPFHFELAAVEATIDSEIAAGQRDPATITTVALRHSYPAYPDGRPIPWPETPDDATLCLWELVHEAVQRALEDVTPVEPNWGDIISDVTDLGRPTPGTFYRVKPEGKGMNWHARAAMMNALEAAGMDPGLGNKSEYWRPYRDLIVCSTWNDALYGSKMPWPPGHQYHYPTPHGRFITLYPRHADNRTRMMQGMVPRRAVNVANPSVYTGNRLPFLWMPRLDLNLLRQGVVAVDGDGLNPPDQVLALGVDDVPEGFTFGCEDFGQLTFRP